LSDFNYIDHYKKDAEEFDYFEERKGATAHDERRVREFIISKIPKLLIQFLMLVVETAGLQRNFFQKES
jgi:hypothetical protein